MTVRPIGTGVGVGTGSSGGGSEEEKDINQRVLNGPLNTRDIVHVPILYMYTEPSANRDVNNHLRLPLEVT